MGKRFNLQKFFFAIGNQPHNTLQEYVRGRFTTIYGGIQDGGGKDIPVYTLTNEAIDEFQEYVSNAIYYACDGRPTDMKTLEKGKYVDILVVLNNYLQRVERANKEFDKLTKNK